VLKGVAVDSAVALVDGNSWGIYRPDAVDEVSFSEFTITGKSLRMTMNTDAGFTSLGIRGTTAFASSEWLDLARRPLSAALRVGDTQIALDSWAPGLAPGQRLALRGRFADGLEAPAVEMVEISEVDHDMRPGGTTTVTLSAGLSQDFDRHALRINGNVAQATHGETTQEVLGSGGGGTPFPTLVAKQSPLTHVTAQVPGGARPEISLRVGGILWHRVPDFLDAGPTDRSYTLTLDPEGVPSIGFGNGITGALPPAGPDNITLEYRTGLGLGGRVRANQLDILMSRPLGVEGVVNPLPSAGGADPEPLSALRENLPLSCRTLDRVVSLSDFADFARAYGGIAKARAERVKLPGLPTPGVVVTVAGEEAAEVPMDGDLYGDLRATLENSGIPFTRFRLMSFRPRYFKMAARVLPEPDRIAADILASVEAALRIAFSFEARGFAQPVFASEVITVMQEVPGVEAVILDHLYKGFFAQRRNVLISDPASPTQGAQLLMLHPGPLDSLEVMA
ncbi:MAG: putative baseplate assembly protein, partial [Pseudomonadota bacterium]